MKAYKWGNELAIVYNSLARFYQLDNNFLHYIVSDTSETSPLADVPQIQNKKSLVMFYMHFPILIF